MEQVYKVEIDFKDNTSAEIENVTQWEFVADNKLFLTIDKNYTRNFYNIDEIIDIEIRVEII